jgi:hypothetical protein
MSDRELFVVEYEDRDPETGNYIVRKLSNGEIVSVPSTASIFILSIHKGQALVLFQPHGHPHGYLLAPI